MPLNVTSVEGKENNAVQKHHPEFKTWNKKNRFMSGFQLFKNELFLLQDVRAQVQMESKEAVCVFNKDSFTV